MKQKGGEFESLTLDCPIFVKRLVLDEVQIVNVDTNEFAPVSYLKIKKFHLEKKPNFLEETRSEVIEVEPEYRFHIPDTFVQ